MQMTLGDFSFIYQLSKVTFYSEQNGTYIIFISLLGKK